LCPGSGTAAETKIQPTGFGLYTAELDVASIGEAGEIDITFRWSDSDR
jgi:hypothetical protein